MEEIIRTTLGNFLKTHQRGYDISFVDDVILSYITTVLTDIAEGDDDNGIMDSVDIEQLIELLSAYVPEICDVDRSSLCEWLLQLSKDVQSIGVEEDRKVSKNSRRKNHTKNSFVSIPTTSKSTATGSQGTFGDAGVKEYVVNRFAYTEDTEGKEYHPVLKQQETKKMTRYRDNMVVSTKGERYTIEPKEKDNDEMKKTYINLKPLRKYRFH